MSSHCTHYLELHVQIQSARSWAICKRVLFFQFISIRILELKCVELRIYVMRVTLIALCAVEYHTKRSFVINCL